MEPALCQLRRHTFGLCADDVPPTRRVNVGDRAIAVSAAPRVCNGLPSDVITSPSLIAFKRRLNTLLFSRSFDL